MAMDLPSLMVTAERMGQGRLLRRLALGAHRNRHAAGGVTWNSRAKAQVFAEAGQSGDAGGLCAHRATGGVRCAGRANSRRSRADGKHYILNGQKMWITNGGAADLFTVFCQGWRRKIYRISGGAEFSRRQQRRGRTKMGITGSSTTAVYLDNVPVPVENVLGEIGRGHMIAFNILNIGRLKLGPAGSGRRKTCSLFV